MSRQQGNFLSTHYAKPNVSNVHIHFESFLSSAYKFDLIYSVHKQLNSCKEVFLKSGHPLSFFDNSLKANINKLLIKDPQVTKVEEKTLILLLPYLEIFPCKQELN